MSYESYNIDDIDDVYNLIDDTISKLKQYRNEFRDATSLLKHYDKTIKLCDKLLKFNPKNDEVIAIHNKLTQMFELTTSWCYRINLNNLESLPEVLSLCFDENHSFKEKIDKSYFKSMQQRLRFIQFSIEPKIGMRCMVYNEKSDPQFRPVTIVDMKIFNGSMILGNGKTMKTELHYAYVKFNKIRPKIGVRKDTEVDIGWCYVSTDEFDDAESYIKQERGWINSDDSFACIRPSRELVFNSWDYYS